MGRTRLLSGLTNMFLNFTQLNYSSEKFFGKHFLSCLDIIRKSYLIIYWPEFFLIFFCPSFCCLNKNKPGKMRGHNIRTIYVYVDLIYDEMGFIKKKFQIKTSCKTVGTPKKLYSIIYV